MKEGISLWRMMERQLAEGVVTVDWTVDFVIPIGFGSAPHIQMLHCADIFKRSRVYERQCVK